jgi:O-antigen ligase
MNIPADAVSGDRGSPLRRLIWLLVALGAFVFVEPAPYDVLAVFVMALAFASGLRIPAGFGPALFLIALFIFANVLATLFSPDAAVSARYASITIYLMLTTVFFAAITAEDTDRTLALIWNAWTVTAIVSVTLGLVAYFHLVPGAERFLYYGRARGAFKDANVYGPFLVPVAIYWLSRFAQATSRGRIAALLIVACVVLGIVMSFSRGALGNLAVAVLLLVALQAGNRVIGSLPRTLAAVFLLATVSVGVLWWASSATGVGAMISERARLVQDYDVGERGRFTILERAARRALQDPTGIGPGLATATFIVDPHNLYLHVLVETGWLGGVAFAAFLFLTFLRSVRFCGSAASLPHGFAAAAASFGALLMQGLLIHSTHWRHLYLLAGMLWGPMLAYAAREGATGYRAVPVSPRAPGPEIP